MSVWYDGTNLNMFQGDTGSIIFSGLPTNKKYIAYFGVTSTTTRDVIFEVSSNVESFWFNDNGVIINKNYEETDEEYRLRMETLSQMNPPQAYNIGCVVIYISAELSNKLIVAKTKDSAEYYFAFKLCNEDGTVENTILPKVYIDENNQLVFPTPPKIIVRPRYVQGMYTCYSTYDTNPELVYIELDTSKLEDVKINVDSMEAISDYGKLSNKPKINGVELDGDLTSNDLGLASLEDIKVLVSTEEQSFTESEREQARKNIGITSIVGEFNPSPTTIAEYVGQTYTNTTTGEMFFCTFIEDGKCTWVKLNQTQSWVFEQPTMSDRWDIQHNLNRYPSVTIIDLDGVEVVGDVTYLNENALCIEFTEAFSGKVFLN